LAKLVDAQGLVNPPSTAFFGAFVALFGLGAPLALSACASDLGVDPLRVVGLSPAEGASHPADQPIRIRFDGYLAPASVAGSATLSSADLEFQADALYDPVERAVVVAPSAHLRFGLGYRVTLSADTLRGADGRALDEDVVLDFVADAALEAERGPAAVVDFEADLAPALAEACGCHGPSPKAFPALTPAALVGQASARRPARTLVVPGAPLESELLLRVLPDYPGVRGAAMPPEGPALSPQASQRLVTWIEGLAR
jgi:hypothetical protein